MIYSFFVNSRDRKGRIKQKQFYLTADSKAQFFTRVREQYSLTQDQVEIQDIIDEDTIDINGGGLKNSKAAASVTVEKPKKKKTKKEALKKPIVKKENPEVAKLLNGNIYGISEQDIKDKRLKGWNILKPKKLKEELTKICNQYDKIKLYYLRTGAKKNKVYVIIYK